ncbi:O-acetyltransferase OatA [Streptomyces sp. ADI96-02]|uniref:acyltransferase family protein n=1 Tax=Streptomyces sp. ADI96-02 TaxID=1522760 RepID=UPI000F553422|nr:acyltransferase [Streptomyces sp. ADI96-02]RPK54051.1 O-acetyltransferase OatA [Streptomyces sp. ADI96-02]
MAHTAPVVRGRTARAAGGRQSHVHALDGLRGVAVAAVLLFHAGLLNGGFLGVDLFFALSGFLITGILLGTAQSERRVPLVRFWTRRARRLLPALVCMVAVALPASWAWGTTAQLRFAVQDAPWVALQGVNWHYITEQVGYWQASDSRVFAHMWSIAVEWQFYLVWPVVVALVARRRHAQRIVLAVAGAGSLVSLALMLQLGAAVDTTRAYEGTDTRAAALLLGAVAATEPVRRRVRRTPGWAADGACAALLTGLGLSWAVTRGEETPLVFQGGLFVHSLAATVLIVLLVEAPRGRAAALVGSRVPTWLGEVSYSLYLWHWPVYLLLLPRLADLGKWGGAAVAIAVSLVLAEASCRFVEDPVRFRSGWARGRRGPRVVAALTVGAVVLWAVLPVPVLGADTVDITQLT